MLLIICDYESRRREGDTYLMVVNKITLARVLGNRMTLWK